MCGAYDTLGMRNIYTNECSKDLEGRDHFETQWRTILKRVLKKYGFLKCEIDISGSRRDRVE